MNDQASDEAFVRQHDRMVRRIAKRVRDELDLDTVDPEELVAYGFSGLLEARSRFDPTRGVKFATFAYYRVRGSMIDGVRKMAFLPRRMHRRRRVAEALDAAAEEAAEQRAANPAQRADIGASLAAIDRVLGIASAAFVISAITPPERPPSPEEATVNRESADRVRAALDVLPERERTLVEGHYFGDRTLDEIGQELGISKSWASRLHARALDRLRKAVSDEEAVANRRAPRVP